MIKYEDYVNLIRSEAWRRLKHNPNLDYDDLIGQGNLAFCLALKSWNPTKGAFSTHLWWTIRDQMGKIGKQLETDNIDDYANTLISKIALPDEMVAFNEAIRELGNEAKEVISLILFSSEELYDFATKLNIQTIKGYLRHEKWQWSAIKQAITEIKLMLKSL